MDCSSDDDDDEEDEEDSYDDEDEEDDDDNSEEEEEREGLDGQDEGGKQPEGVKKAAAAMAVSVGNLSDPEHCQVRARLESQHPADPPPGDWSRKQCCFCTRLVSFAAELQKRADQALG